MSRAEFRVQVLDLSSQMLQYTQSHVLSISGELYLHSLGVMTFSSRILISIFCTPGPGKEHALKSKNCYLDPPKYPKIGRLRILT